MNPVCVGCRKTYKELGCPEGYCWSGDNRRFFCEDCFHKVPEPPPWWHPARFISWGMRLDHWTRKPLLFLVYPLALAGSLWHAVPGGRAFTFGFWDLEWRMWWVTWDGMLVGPENRTTWWWQ
jgi:hypothetical protein